jgi:hypothetical protein
MDFDKRGFDEADDSVDSLSTGFGTLAKAISVTAVAMGGLKLLNLASDANETMNVLNATFEGSSQRVQTWATNFANAAGRSQYEMRQMAGTIGSVLKPMMDGNSEAAARMAIGLSALAVDLRSFYNLASDDAALEKLRAGITGESEPLKQLGVVMSQAALQNFAMEKGIRKNIKAMSEAEKTALRYEFIMAKTVDAQGDAIKTSEGWANSTQALMGFLKDLGTTVGLVMLPMAERVLNWTKNLVQGFTELVKGTEIVKAGLIVLGAIAAAQALRMLIAFGPIILKFLLIAAAIAAATLVVEDFIAFLQGKKSVIGEFIDLIAGPGSAEQAALFLRQAWEGFILWAQNALIPGIEGIGKAVTWWKDDVIDWAKGIWNATIDYLQPAITIISKLIGWITKGGAVMARFLGIDLEGLKRDFNSLADSVGNRISGAFSNPFAGSVYGSSLVGAERAGREQFMRENEAAIRANPLLAASAGQQGRQVIANMSQELNVNVTGLSDREAARKIANEIATETKRANRSTMKAVTQRAE